MFKVEFINIGGIKVSEIAEDQYKLVQLLSTLDGLDCEIIGVTTVKKIPMMVLRG